LERLLIAAGRAEVAASLARGFAHDLRGPLQTLTLMVDPHADLFGGGDGPRLRTAVSDAVQGLTDTISRFSDIYAPVEPEPAPVIVDDMLSAVTELQRYQRGLPAVEVELRLPGGLAPVRAVEPHLRHILLALLINAKESMVEQPEHRLVLGAGTGDGVVRLFVEDTGPGPSPETVDRAFEPFFTTRPGHLGIGLTVARLLATRHGGSLTLARGSEGGGRAELTIPSWRRGG
jgi:signal transduction histidine kinase